MAQAIFEAEPNFEGQPVDNLARKQARAVLAIMRRPSPVMLDKSNTNRSHALYIWESMIDGALSD